MANLMTRRRQLQTMIVMEETRRRTCTPRVRGNIDRSLAHLRQLLKDLDREIHDAIRRTPRIFRKHRLGLNLSFFRDYWDFLGSWLPPLLLGGAILALSGSPGSANNTQIILNWLLSWFPSLSLTQVNYFHYFLRKTGHAVAYGFLYFLWFRALRGYKGYPVWRASLWSLFLCLVVASLDESHQSLFISRTGNIHDVALDMVGASMSAIITSIFWTPQFRPQAK